MSKKITVEFHPEHGTRVYKGDEFIPTPGIPFLINPRLPVAPIHQWYHAVDHIGVDPSRPAPEVVAPAYTPAPKAPPAPVPEPPKPEQVVMRVEVPAPPVDVEAIKKDVLKHVYFVLGTAVSKVFKNRTEQLRSLHLAWSEHLSQQVKKLEQDQLSQLIDSNHASEQLKELRMIVHNSKRYMDRELEKQKRQLVWLAAVNVVALVVHVALLIAF